MITKKVSTEFPDFVTGEPSHLKRYDPGFLNRFGTVITSHQNIEHEGVDLFAFPSSLCERRYACDCERHDAALVPETRCKKKPRTMRTLIQWMLGRMVDQ